jgi:hypothetical protein
MSSFAIVSRFLGTVAALITSAALAGCGGGSSTFYDATATRSCLRGKLLSVRDGDADYIALAAVGGGYLVRVGPTFVNVSFYRTSDDARDNLEGYKAFGMSEGPKLYTKGNALLAWDDTPTSDEKSSVDGCLTAG